MTKKEFIRNIQNAVTIDIPQKDIVEILKGIGSVVEEAVLNGEDVTIPGVCKITTKVVPERKGKMAFGADGEKEWVKPEHKKVCVSAAYSLKKIFDAR